MRSPLQGGLPPVGAMTDAELEIACDESGFSGSNLQGADTPVITHASVDLRADEAAELLAALPSAFPSRPKEVKSAHLLRGRDAGPALERFLAALAGRAHVHLVDKEGFLATRIVDLFLAEPSYAAGTRLSRDDRPAALALALHRTREAADDDWSALLAAFVELVRVRRRRRPEPGALQRFFEARDALARHDLGGQAGDVLARLDPSHVTQVVTRLGEEDRSIPPPLEPLLPALAETVLFWSAGRRRVLVVHDEQSVLPADRLTRLQRALAQAADPSTTLPAGVSPLSGLVMVDSREDPRVQVADLLAGVARRLAGTDADGLLRPFLSATSVSGAAG